jgi:hypothetical protein
MLFNEGKRAISMKKAPIHSGYERYPGNYRRYYPQTRVQSKGLLMRKFLRL